MNVNLMKRIGITLTLLGIPMVIGLLFTYQVINIRWISFMSIQPSFRPMDAPQPVPARSVSIEGAAFIPGVGAPQNPTAADAASLSRGKTLFNLHCSLCHGSAGKGDGPVAKSLVRKPADLSGPNVKNADDGTLFLIISNGVQNVMPPLRENLNLHDRWDVVNYVRSLQK